MDAEEVAEVQQYLAHLAVRDEQQWEAAKVKEVLNSMLRRRLKRIVRDCWECLGVIDCWDSPLSVINCWDYPLNWKPTDLTPFLTASRDAEQVLACLNARLARNSPH
jgi:hypothetical protein